MAAKGLSGEDSESLDVKKSLLLRAARIFNESASDLVGAERAYVEVLELDPLDTATQSALDDVRRANGKFSEVVESLISRSESAAPGEELARIFSEIGRLCATELEDPDQGILAYARALCEVPDSPAVAEEIERLAEGKPPLWNEVLATLTESIQGGGLAPDARNALLAHAARWYAAKIRRPDLAVMGYQQILEADRTHAAAHEGLIAIYREAQQWPELVSALTAYADVAGNTPRTRDLRAEAGEIYEVHLNDPTRARDAYAKVLVEDATHAKASEGMERIAESTGDYETLAGILEQRAESARGREKTEALLKIAELYEDQLGDLAEAERRFEAVLEVQSDDLSRPQGPRPHLQPHEQVPRAARQPRAAGGGRGHAPAEDQPLRAHGVAARRGVPRPRARGRVPRVHPHPRPRQRRGADEARSGITARSRAGRRSTSSTRSTRR